MNENIKEDSWESVDFNSRPAPETIEQPVQDEEWVSPYENGEITPEQFFNDMGGQVPPTVDAAPQPQEIPPSLQESDPSTEPTTLFEKYRQQYPDGEITSQEEYNEKFPNRLNISEQEAIAQLQGRVDPEALSHKGKLALQGTVSGIAGTVDLIRYPIGAAANDESLYEELGISKEYSLQDASKDAIKQMYTYFGDDGAELAVPQDFEDHVLYYTSENLGALSPVAVGRNWLKKAAQASTVKTVDGVVVKASETAAKEALGVRFFDDFLKTEVRVSGAGGLTAGFASTLAVTEQDKKDFAELGNILGSLGYSMSPTSFAVKRLIGLKNKVTSVDLDALWEKHDKAVLHNLAKLVPEEDVPKLHKRIDRIIEIQRFIPEFRPSVGNVINTGESRQIQSQIDSDNFNEATSIYRKNKNAIEKAAKMLVDTSDPAQREAVRDALTMLQDESRYQTHLLQARISALQSEMIDMADPNLNLTEAAEATRKALLDAQGQYKLHIDSLYQKVDPENKTRFNVDELINMAEAVSKKGDLSSTINKEHGGYTWLTKDLPDYFRKLKGNQPNIPGLGMIPKETTVSFMELHNIRKAINSQAASIAEEYPSSGVSGRLKKLGTMIDEIMDTKMTEGDPDAVERYLVAKEAFSSKFQPRFREGAVSKITKVGNKKMDTDQILAHIWDTSSDTKESAFRTISDIFQDNDIFIANDEIFSAARSAVMKSVEDYALNDLTAKLRSAGDGIDTDRMSVFRSWMDTNKRKLNNFPALKEEVDDIGRRLTAKSYGIEEDMDIVKDLTNNVIKKYTLKDPNLLIREYMGKTPGEARELFFDLLSRRGLAPNFDPKNFPFMEGLRQDGSKVELRSIEQLINQIPSEEIRKEAKALHRAISENTLQVLLNDSFSADVFGFDIKKFSNKMDSLDEYVKGETLQTLMDSDTYNSASLLRQAATLLGSETGPVRKVELSGLAATFKELGVLPASISSRMYAAQLGKVGPLYLAVDFAQRAIRGVSDMRAKEIYTRTMYDLDGLKKMVDMKVAAGKGDPEALEQLRNLEGGLRNAFKTAFKNMKDPEKIKEKLVSALNASNLMKGIRIEDYLDEQYMEDSGALVDMYLEANDDYTGQPSRVSTSRAAYQMLHGVEKKSESVSVEELIERETSKPEVSEEAAAIIKELQANEEIVGKAATSLAGFKKTQEDLAKEPVTKTVKLNPETGEVQWQ